MKTPREDTPHKPGVYPTLVWYKNKQYRFVKVTNHNVYKTTKCELCAACVNKKGTTLLTDDESHDMHDFLLKHSPEIRGRLCGGSRDETSGYWIRNTRAQIAKYIALMLEN